MALAPDLLFNLKWYLDHNPDVAEAFENGIITDPYQHFLEYGKAEGRSSSPLFNVEQYLLNNPDVAAAVEAGLITAYDHFTQYGASEGRAPSNLFDASFYLNQNPDVAEAVEGGAMTAIEHFLMYGQSEPRPFSPSIDLAAYLEANPDIKAAVEAGQMSAMDHLMLYGAAEGRDLGNGVDLSIFADDSTFADALEAGDVQGALDRVAEVAPFLPTFVPPENWEAPADTPIPVDFVPPEGTKLVIPPTVVVPPDTELPDTFEPPEDTGGGGGGETPDTFMVAINDAGEVSFSGSATDDITMTVEDGIATFTRGSLIASTTPDIDDITKITVVDATLQATADVVFDLARIDLQGSAMLRVETSFTELSEEHQALESVNISKVFVGDSNAPAIVWDKVSVVSENIADKFKLFWVTGDEKYYAVLDTDETTQKKAVNDANLDVSIIYAEHILAGNAPIFDVVQTKRPASGDFDGGPHYAVRQQSLHDNLLANLNNRDMNGRIENGELTPRELSDEVAEFGQRPYHDGVLSKETNLEKTIAWDLAHDIPRDATEVLETVGNEAYLIHREEDTFSTITKHSTIQLAVNAPPDDNDTIFVGPGEFYEEIEITDLTGDVRLAGTTLSDEVKTEINAAGIYAIKATAGFTGTVTIEGFNVVAGTEGGIGQFMSASAGQFHVLNNVITTSETSYTSHGNSIQISGNGSTVIGNTVEVVEYTRDVDSWSTSGITVVKGASNATISNNSVTNPDAISDGNSVTGIAVDAFWTEGLDGLENISITDNTLSKITAGISLSDHLQANVANNTLSNNTVGISLGTTRDGWDDDLTITITENTFTENGKAIALYDFDAGGTITIEDNIFASVADMTGAIWLNDSGTYDVGSAVKIDLAQFDTGDGQLADNVIYTGEAVDDAANSIWLEMKQSVTDSGDMTITWESGAFTNLTLTLTGVAGYEGEIADLFGSPVLPT